MSGPNSTRPPTITCMPKLRPVRGFAQKAGEQVRLGIADRSQISQAVVFGAAPRPRRSCPKLDGSRDLDQIVTRS